MSETTAPAPRPNRFPGPCWYCGSKVPAGAGTYDGSVRHLPGRCKRTTKTYRATIAAARQGAYREYADRMLAAAGYEEIPVHGFEPTIYRGHGLTGYVGSHREVRTADGWAMERVGFEIRRGGQLVYKGDQPRYDPAADHYGALIDRYTEIIATLNSHRQDIPEGTPA